MVFRRVGFGFSVYETISSVFDLKNIPRKNFVDFEIFGGNFSDCKFSSFRRSSGASGMLFRSMKTISSLFDLENRTRKDFVDFEIFGGCKTGRHLKRRKQYKVLATEQNCNTIVF